MCYHTKKTFNRVSPNSKYCLNFLRHTLHAVKIQKWQNIGGIVSKTVPPPQILGRPVPPSTQDRRPWLLLTIWLYFVCNCYWIMSRWKEFYFLTRCWHFYKFCNNLHQLEANDVNIHKSLQSATTHVVDDVVCSVISRLKNKLEKSHRRCWHSCNISSKNIEAMLLAWTSLQYETRGRPRTTPKNDNIVVNENRTMSQ
jgi:hypothetical protein